MDILMSETCWAHNKWNKIASDVKLVFHSSTMSQDILFTFCNRCLLNSCILYTMGLHWRPMLLGVCSQLPDSYTQIFLSMRIYFRISTRNFFRCVRWRLVQVFSCSEAEWNIGRHVSYTVVRICAINCTSLTPCSTSWQSTYALYTTQFMTHIKTAAIIRECRFVQQVQHASSGRDLFGSRKIFVFVLHTEYK